MSKAPEEAELTNPTTTPPPSKPILMSKAPDEAELTDLTTTSPPSKPLLVYLDLETTGLGISTDISTIEIGATVADHSGETFSSLVYTSREIQSEASAKVHGIYNHDLVKEEPFPVVFQQFTTWLADTTSKLSKAAGLPHHPVLVAHNGFNYDYEVLISDIKLHQLDINFPDNTQFADSLNHLRQLKEIGNPLVSDMRLGLQSLCKHFLSDQSPPEHRALKDAENLKQLFTETELRQLLPFAPLYTYQDLISNWERKYSTLDQEN